MPELDVQKAHRLDGLRAPDVAPPAAEPGRRSGVPDRAAADPAGPALANAQRDVAAIRDIALPAFVAALQDGAGGEAVVHTKIDQAKHKLHALFVAAADRVSAVAPSAHGAELVASLDSLVATATALGAFVGYESLLPHVRARTAPAQPANPGPRQTPAGVAVRVTRSLDMLRFVTELDGAIAALRRAGADAEQSVDDPVHLATEGLGLFTFPGASLWVDGDSYGSTRDAGEAARVLQGELSAIRMRLGRIQRDVAALSGRFEAQGVVDAAALAETSFAPALQALRTRFELLGGTARATEVAATAEEHVDAADHTLGMTARRVAPAFVSVLAGVPGVDFQVGELAGLAYGAGAAVRDLFAGAIDLVELCLSSWRDFLLAGGFVAEVQACQQLGELLAKSPELVQLIGAELATEWRAASWYARGELVGKIVGYIAMTAVLAVASGSETLELQLAASGSELAAWSLRLLRLTEAAANPMTYLGPVAKLAKLPTAVVEFLTRGARARKAAAEAAEAERLAAEAATKAVRAWAETAEGARVAKALERGGASLDVLAKLTEAQRAGIAEIHALIARGDLAYATAALQRMVDDGLEPALANQIGDALAHGEGKTPLAMYRAPEAEVPDPASPGAKLRVKPLGPGRILFHGTDKVPPEVVYAEGLSGRGGNLDLYEHALQAPDSAFRGTTTFALSPNQDAGAVLWADDGGWVYEIDGVVSWDLNGELENKIIGPDNVRRGNPMPAESEQTILANVPKERIRGSYTVRKGKHGLERGPFVPNPNYRPLTAGTP